MFNGHHHQPHHHHHQQPIHGLPPKPVFDNGSPLSLSPSNKAPAKSKDENYPVSYSFCIPFSILPGPDPDDIITASPGAKERWIQSVERFNDTDTPAYSLPIHQANVDTLRKLCKEISDALEFKCEAALTVSEPQHGSYRQTKRGIITNVWLSGHPESVLRARGVIMQNTPVALRSAYVNIDRDQIYDDENVFNQNFFSHLEHTASFTGTDIFLLKTPGISADAAAAADLGNSTSQSNRLQIKIYGDYESVEHAKTRVLVAIDDMLGQVLDTTMVELSTQSLICGRGRKNIKHIESQTRTAIYFPPPFPRIYSYRPPHATSRDPDQVFITGSCREDIAKAERMLVNIRRGLRLYVKDVSITMTKLDYLLLERLDDIKKIMEANATYVQLPRLGSLGQRDVCMRIQGTETLNIERTVRSIMAICGQYYNATWWMIPPDMHHGELTSLPAPQDLRKMITDISAFSGADIAFNKQSFDMCGVDDCVKIAMHILSEVRLVKQYPFQTRVKIELANEHKEFVSGKKNGKINKIMGQAGIQIVFDAFNEYNFFIDVVSNNFEQAALGLHLVEHELPASVSFHVPDSYHKRIIGVGGQHIQRIMKKYSVFVKFSNAMERGSAGRMESDDSKVDNVVCRTPARNAKNLELVKTEIMKMVQQADAEIVEENVIVPRLLHRPLMAQRQIFDDLEAKWGCSVIFPSTESASDVVKIKGPEWQIPQAVHEFLSHVPESHKIQLSRSKQLEDLIHGEAINHQVTEPMRRQFGIEMNFERKENYAKNQTVSFTYTRNNAGGVRDAIDMLTTFLVANGVDAEPVNGALPRPKSDSFEDYAPFFEQRILQKTSPVGSLGSTTAQGNRLSVDMGILGGPIHGEPGPLTEETEAAFYEGARKASIVASATSSDAGSAGMSAPGSAVSSSARLANHQRSGSIASLSGWDGIPGPLLDGEDWTKLEVNDTRSRSSSVAAPYI